MAELKLEKLIQDVENISNIRNLDALNPKVVRLSHPTNRQVTAIVAAHREPHTLVLPLNVTWMVYDPLSTLYRKALRRVSKEPDVVAGTEHTWEVVELYDDVFVTQYYDDADTALLTTQNPVSIATTDTLGVVRISVESETPSNPVGIVEGDPRLSDPRQPLPHTHPERPATQLKTATGVVTIGGSDAPEEGAVLIATSPTTAVWRKLSTSDIQQ